MVVDENPSLLFDQDYNCEASSLSLNKSRNTSSTSIWSCYFCSSDDSMSVLSCPVDESELGSTETESEESEEDYLAKLSRQMAHYMLQDDDHEQQISDLPSVSSSAKSKQALIDDQIRSIQYYKLNLKQDQPVKQQYKNKSRSNIIDPLQSLNSDLRAGFRGGSGSKTKSCGGTGVFLPQGIGQASGSRKKQGCSTVLIPARVVQALKQHFDKVGVPSRFTGNFPLQNDGLMGLENNGSSNSQQQRPASTLANHPEIALPQEWTY